MLATNQRARRENVMSLRIDKETYQTMKEVSEKTSLAKSTIARIALETFLRNVKKEGLTLPLEK